MTKSEYMKKLSYSLRRLPKEDFNQAIDYFEEYFAEAGEENEQQAIEDLGSPEDAAKELATMKDSALYPILKRLQENHFVETYDRQFQGRNRKYYTITDAGRQYLAELTEEWERYRTVVDDIVKGGNLS